MKQRLKRLLNMLGLVTVGRYNVVVGQLRAAEASARQLSTVVKDARAESKAWKQKADEARSQVKSLKEVSLRRRQQNERLVAQIARTEAQMAATEAEALRHRVEGNEMETRLAEAERQLGLTREHLMALEVKLDILEGAANVLDQRSRAIVLQQAGDTGVQVGHRSPAA